MKWKRDFNCGVCGEAVIYDEESKVLQCVCGVVQLKVGLPAFQLLTRFMPVDGLNEAFPKQIGYPRDAKSASVSNDKVVSP